MFFKPQSLWKLHVEQVSICVIVCGGVNVLFGGSMFCGAVWCVMVCGMARCLRCVCSGSKNNGKLPPIEGEKTCSMIFFCTCVFRVSQLNMTRHLAWNKGNSMYASWKIPTGSYFLGVVHNCCYDVLVFPGSCLPHLLLSAPVSAL